MVTVRTPAVAAGRTQRLRMEQLHAVRHGGAHATERGMIAESAHFDR